MTVCASGSCPKLCGTREVIGSWGNGAIATVTTSPTPGGDRDDACQEDGPVSACEEYWADCLEILCKRLRAVAHEDGADGADGADGLLQGAGTFADLPDAEALSPGTGGARAGTLLGPDRGLGPSRGGGAERQVVAGYRDGSCREESRASEGDSTGREESAGLRLRLNRVLARVGTRVPWGRLHRGKFAKVSKAERAG